MIGSDCTLGKNVFVDEGVLIGDRVKIQNNVSVYKGVELADEVFVGPSAVFTNDLRPRAVAPDWQLSPTKVARGASVGANATIVCGTEIGEHAIHLKNRKAFERLRQLRESSVKIADVRRPLRSVAPRQFQRFVIPVASNQQTRLEPFRNSR